MNPHDILGVAPDATPEQIKSAYRKLAMKHHPDKGGDAAEFQKIQEAYDALTKPKAQQRDTRTGHPFGDDHPFARSGFAWAFRDGNGTFWSSAPPTNPDYSTNAGISLEQAYEGTTLSITIREDKIITINVPRGIQHGARLTIRGEGSHENKDLPPGDLHVVIIIRPHPVYQFSGHDLLTVRNIDVIDMLTGCDVEIETLSGEKLTVTVPPGSTPNTRLRLPGKGMPMNADGTRFGSLFIAISPLFPKLTPEQIEKLRELKKA